MLSVLATVAALTVAAGCSGNSLKVLRVAIKALPEAQSVLFIAEEACRITDCVQTAKDLFKTESYPVKAESGAPTNDDAALIVLDATQHTMTRWTMTSKVAEISAVQNTPSRYALNVTKDPLRVYLWTENAAELQIEVHYDG